MSEHASGAETREFAERLHFDFVGMMFALAIGQAAVSLSDVIDARSGQHWPLIDCWPAFTHVLLVVLMIAASWVSWGQSKSARSQIASIWSRDFIELLIDVWIVICYFQIARTVDGISGEAAFVPSAGEEAWWTMVVFVSYATWDALTKLRSGQGDQYRQRGWASLTAAILSVLVWRICGDCSTWGAVILADVALVMLVLAFRAMKSADWSKQTPAQRRRWRLLSALSLLLALVA
ncbi:MAG: hypothetical protein AB7O97_07890 [Planctomycetota bacterium]